MSAPYEYCLEVIDLTKTYNSFVANDKVGLKVKPGEIHAVLGENGAGKSTLMKMIYGATSPDSGSILINGREVDISTPAKARALGIGMVYQHFSLFDTLTVTENIALVSDQKFDLKKLAQQISEVSEKYGLNIDPNKMVASLSVGEKQRVEIIRCLLLKPKILILDEPTSVLTPQAVQKLFETLRQLASEGVSILYISHKLHEIMALCNSATILRLGKVTASINPHDYSIAGLAQLMIGKELTGLTILPSDNDQQTAFEVKNLNYKPDDIFGTTLKNINLQLKTGEILGIAGISGNGQAELLKVLSGEQLVAGAHISLEGAQIARCNPAKRRKHGLNFVPEERLGRGAVPSMTLSQNGLLTAFLKGLTDKGLIKHKQCDTFADAVIAQYDVRCGQKEQSLAKSLSGGNLQKFIVGREIEQSPKVFIVSQPTWGVDVGAAQFIRQKIIELSRQNVAVLVVSEELDEIMEVSDVIAVINQGELSTPMPKADVSAEKLGLLMASSYQNAKQPDTIV